MRENDNTMNSMKPNGAPHIDDEGTDYLFV